MNNLYEISRGLNKYDLTPEEIANINLIEFDKADQGWVNRQVLHYLANDFPIDMLAKNYLRIRSLGRDSNSVRSYVIRFGWALGVELFEEKVRQTKTPKGRFSNIKKER